MQQRVDTEKIIALKNAGWEMEQIAAEMDMEPTDILAVLSGLEETAKEKTGEDTETQKTAKMVLITLTPEQLKSIYERAAAIGAKEALKNIEQERKKEYAGRADRRLRNTKLLLRNYHMLKEHAEKSVFGRTQMKESALDILESMMSMHDNEVIIESIKRSAARTAIIISHIDTMIGLYAAYCNSATNREVEMRRYEVIRDMYIADTTLSVKEIADKQHMSKDNVYTDLRIATERLTALIFGVDGLNVR